MLTTYYYPAKVTHKDSQFTLEFVDFKKSFIGRDYEDIKNEAAVFLCKKLGNLLSEKKDLPSPRARENFDASVPNGWYEYISVTEEEIESAMSTPSTPRSDYVEIIRKLSPRVVQSLEEETHYAKQRMREQQENAAVSSPLCGRPQPSFLSRSRSVSAPSPVAKAGSQSLPSSESTPTKSNMGRQ